MFPRGRVSTQAGSLGAFPDFGTLRLSVFASKHPRMKRKDTSFFFFFAGSHVILEFSGYLSEIL